MAYLVRPSDMKMNILVYGKPGVGKTVFGASANDHEATKDALILNVEGGLLSVAGRGDVLAEDVHSVAKLEEIFWKLANRDPEYATVKTLVIDSGSELQTLSLEEIVGKAIKKKKGDREVDDVYLEDYGKSTAQLKRIFRWFRDLPINVVVTALPKYAYPKGQESNPNAEPTEVCPSLTSKLSESLMGYMDFVWYMYVAPDPTTGQPRRYMLTQEKGVYRAKTRGVKFSEAIGPIVADPSIPALYDALMASEGR